MVKNVTLRNMVTENVLKFRTKLISILNVRNFKNYDLQKILLFEIFGQIPLQPKLTWLTDAFGHLK